MKAPLTTTVALSVGLTLGVNQSIQAAVDSSPSKNIPFYLEAQFNSDNTGAQNKKREELASEKATNQQLERTEQRELTHLENTERREAEQLKREEMKTQQLEHTERQEVEQLEREKMRTQQLEKTGQQEMEQFERDKAATQESTKKAQMDARRNAAGQGSAQGVYSSPTQGGIPTDDPAYTRQQLQNKQDAGHQSTPEESQQFPSDPNAQETSREGSAPQPADPALRSSVAPDYDPAAARATQQQAIDQGIVGNPLR